MAIQVHEQAVRVPAQVPLLGLGSVQIANCAQLRAVAGFVDQIRNIIQFTEIWRKV